MRRSFVVALCAVLLVGLLLPSGAFAKKVTVSGSLTIAKCSNPPSCTSAIALNNEFVGAAVTSNPGFKHPITLQIPPFTFPTFVKKDKDNSDPEDFDTTLALVNVSGSTQTIKLTLRDVNGTPQTLTTDIFVVDPNHTLVISLSDLIP